MVYSFEMTPRMLSWLSRFGCTYTLSFISVVFITAHVEIYPTLYPLPSSPLPLLHRVFSIYLLISFLLNFLLCYFNNSFVPPLKNHPAIHQHSFNSYNDNNQTYYSTQFNINPTPPLCSICLTPRPARSHHCVICHRCVLVREHHCFVLGTCIGQQNLRHFLCILLLLIIGTLYTLAMSLIYITLYYPLSPSSIHHYFLPFTILEAIFGYQPWHFVFHVAIIYTASLSFIGSAYSFIYHLSLTLRGITSHEHHTHKPGPNKPPFSNFKDTCGQHWYLGFICPLLFREIKIDNGVKSV